MKLPRDRRPLYLQAEEALTTLLVSDYRAGDRLPPEPELAAQLGISRSTLREAMRSCEDRGLISRRQGVGTFVNAPSPAEFIESGLESLESVDALARRKGLNVTDRDVEIAAEAANELTARRLSLDMGALVVKVARTKMEDGRPVAYIVDVVPASVVALDELRAGFQGSVLDFLQARGAPALSYARARIVSTAAGANVGRRLQVQRTAPLLLIEETLFSADGTAIEFSQNYFIPSFFQFHVIRRIGG